MALLEVKNIQKHFGKVDVLRGVDFTLERGEVLAIIGSSGSGKTTLLRCLNFLETANHGSFSVGDEILFDADVPTGVAINEAVELAKQFGGDDSSAFINGILGKIAAAHEKNEAAVEQTETEKA